MLPLSTLTFALLRNITCSDVKHVFHSADCCNEQHSHSIGTEWLTPFAKNVTSVESTCGNLEAALSQGDIVCDNPSDLSDIVGRSCSFGKRLSLTDIRPVEYQYNISKIYPDEKSTTRNSSYDEMYEEIDRTFSFCECDRVQLWMTVRNLCFCMQSYPRDYYEFLMEYDVSRKFRKYCEDDVVMRDGSAASHFSVCMEYDDYYRIKHAYPEHCIGFKEREDANGDIVRSGIPLITKELQPVCITRF